MHKVFFIFSLLTIISCQSGRMKSINMVHKTINDSTRISDSISSQNYEESEKFKNYIITDKPDEKDITIVHEGCAVSIRPDSLQIVRLKGTTPEEQDAFYIAADDNNYYQVQAWDFFENLGIKTVHPNTRYIKFVLKNDTILFDTRAKYSPGWMIILFLKDQRPDIIDYVDIDSAYNNYLKQQ